MPEAVYDIGEKLFDYAKKHETPFNPFDLKWWNRHLLNIGMSDANLKDQLFRFVDVLPALNTDREIAEYFIEYLSDWNKGVAGILEQSARVKGFDMVSALAIKTGVKIMAKTFIAGRNVDEVLAKIRILESKGQLYTLDLLGELVVSEEEAQHHTKEYLHLIKNIPNSNVSVKLSGLYSQIEPRAFESTKEILKDRLREIYRVAVQHNAFVNIDLEHYAWKDLTNAVFKELLMEDEFREWTGAGIVVQGYLQDSKKDLLDLIAWAKERGTQIMVRLVKGAYWDYEKTIAEQNGWPCPVFTDKAETDLNYEELAKILFDNYKHTKPAIASHNIRSISYALSLAKERGLKKSEFEFQMLYGMLDSVKEYLAKEDVDVRVYLPYGELIPGMAYLVRRLLENTANESFLKLGFSDKTPASTLLKDPREMLASFRDDEPLREPSRYYHKFKNSADSDYSKAKNRAAMQAALKERKAKMSPEDYYPLIIDGNEIHTDKNIESINPANISHVLGHVALGDESHCRTAIKAAHKSFKLWSQLDVQIRAGVLKNLAARIERDRFKFASLLVFEGGKPWVEADAEVSEIVDFLVYYAEQAIDLFEENRLLCLSGEKNTNHYQALGVAAVIPPWNFPLAIMGGMTAAALVSGNTAIIKPASQTPIIAYEFVQAFRQEIKAELSKHMPASQVDGYNAVINYLPGPGSKIGSYLVDDPNVKAIAFTGSCEVGMNINHKANANPKVVKRVVAEMGGKNTIIVDESADMDEAVPGVLYSAFGYAGQKCSACSRVVVVESVYNHFVERLKHAASSVIVDEAEKAESYLSSVIDEAAMKQINEYIEIGKRESRLHIGADKDGVEVPDTGYYVSPTIFIDVAPNSKIAQEEIFGPVLAVIKARDIDDAIEIANNTQFGLTAGLFSRSPENIAQVSRDIEVGNFYINRPCTGAIVARQSFGGTKLSSIGFKAGGPHYLLQFVQEKTITENTMRQGFTID